MSGVEIPSALIEAHESSELVIFVGAGASIPLPSGLPGFKELVEVIRDQSNLRDVIGEIKDQPLDELLSNIEEEHGVPVHERAAELIDKPGSMPSLVHQGIIKLTSAATPRIVSTNYDRHLSTLIDAAVPEYLAPALPVGDDFSGIVYLHGRLDQEPRKLVLTADDFGKAYLADAWAARFLDRMFASHPVLFVGYSHTDTIMKYLARGLGGRAQKRYAFTHDADIPLWRQLGITPIKCSYDDLPIVLDDWASKASCGLLGHREHVKALVENQDPSQTPEAMSYLESIVSRKDTIKFFTQYARGQAWLRWIAGMPEFKSLFFSLPQVHPTITNELARWFAENFITDDDLSDVSLEIATEAAEIGGSLRPELAFEACRSLVSQTMPIPGRMRRWLPLITQIATSRYHVTFLEEILRRSAAAGDSNTAMFLFSYLTEPQPKLTHSLRGGAFDVEMRGTCYSLRDTWDNVFKPALSDFAQPLLAVADRHLRRADLELTITDDNGYDRNRPSVFRTAIESVPDDQYDNPLGLLVDVARDSLESLLGAGQPEVYAFLDAWAASEVTLLRRLALHGWTKRTDKSASEKIRWVCDIGWLPMYELRHELARLVSDAVGAADTGTSDELVRQVVSRAGDDEYAPRRTYTWLIRISEAAPELESAKTALASLVAGHPEFVEEPNSAGEESQSAWSTPPPTTADELHRKLVNELAQTVEALKAYWAERSRYEDSERWDRLTVIISQTIQEWPGDGLSLLNAVGSGYPEIDSVVVMGWARAQLDSELAARILQRVQGLEIRPILGYVTAMLAGFLSQGSGVKWHTIAESGDLAKQCWETIGPDVISGSPASEPASVAANHPAGHLAIFWVDALVSAWAATRDTWSGIPADVADYLRDMVSANDHRGEMVETIFGQKLHFFYEADSEWCKQVLLPRFDWNDEGRARRVWDGYLSGGRWNNRLVAEGFVQKLLLNLPHHEQFRADRMRRLFIQLADIAIYADTDPQTWLPNLLSAPCSPADRVEWAEALGHELSRVEPSVAEREWHRWIGDYWSNRTRGVPRDLEPAEASAMARWTLFFTNSMEEAIDLVVRTSTAGFGTRMLIFRDLTNDRIDKAPKKLAQMIGYLLQSTQLPEGQPVLFGSDLQRVHTRFSEDHVSEDALRVIAEEAIRLGIDLR